MFTKKRYVFGVVTILIVALFSVSGVAFGRDSGNGQSADGDRISFWSLTGNGGTRPTRNFLGTTDNQPLVIRTNGEEAVRVLPSGRVGIGVTVPRDFVHLYQDAPVTVGVLMGNSYVGNDRSGFLVNYHWSGAGAELWNFENTDMWFGTNNTRRMTIENDGDIGVGTSNPNSKLEVSNGYFELDTSAGIPPAADCDAANEVGRMKVDSANTNLYICTAAGWVTK